MLTVSRKAATRYRRRRPSGLAESARRLLAVTLRTCRRRLMDLCALRLLLRRLLSGRIGAAEVGRLVCLRSSFDAECAHRWLLLGKNQHSTFKIQRSMCIRRQQLALRVLSACNNNSARIARRPPSNDHISQSAVQLAQFSGRARSLWTPPKSQRAH